jgi:hypothetical protein
VYNCISNVNVSGSFSGTGGSGNFFMGGVVGNEVDNQGGYIINSYATGSVTGLSPATIGGITGGGGRSPNNGTPDSEIKGCVALNISLNAGGGSTSTGGRGRNILGQWPGPTTGGIVTSCDSYNYFRNGLVLTNDPRIPILGPNDAINGTGVPLTYLQSWSTYASFGWSSTDWGGIGSDGYPKLRWE